MNSKLKVLDLNSLNKSETIILETISSKIIYDFNELVKKIFLSNKIDSDWIVNVLISRNNYFSSFYLDLCYLIFIKEVIKSNNFDLIIVPSNKLKKTLVKYFDQNSIKIKIKSSEKLFSGIAIYFTIFKNLLYNILLSLNMILASLLSKKKREFKKDLILIDTWVTDSEFKKKVYKNRYYDFNYLNNHLDTNIKNKVCFIPEFNFKMSTLLKFKLKYFLT